jgi:hypothetical protein
MVLRMQATKPFSEVVNMNLQHSRNQDPPLHFHQMCHEVPGMLGSTEPASTKFPEQKLRAAINPVILINPPGGGLLAIVMAIIPI